MVYIPVKFDRSFLIFLTHRNSYGRFAVSSVLTVWNKQKEREEVYYLLTGVLACDVFGKDELIYQPAYMYQAVFGSRKCKILRTHYPLKDQDSVWNIQDYFQGVNYNISRTIEYKSLEDTKEVKAAVLNGEIISARLMYPVGEYVIEIECPVQHINVSADKEEFQVETGPVLFLESGKEIEDCSPGYLCFNSFEKLEYSLYEKGKRENADVRHYWETKRINATIQLQVSA